MSMLKLLLLLCDEAAVFRVVDCAVVFVVVADVAVAFVAVVDVIAVIIVLDLML